MEIVFSILFCKAWPSVALYFYGCSTDSAYVTATPRWCWCRLRRERSRRDVQSTLVLFINTMNICFVAKEKDAHLSHLSDVARSVARHHIAVVAVVVRTPG